MSSVTGAGGFCASLAWMAAFASAADTPMTCSCAGGVQLRLTSPLACPFFISLQAPEISTLPIAAVAARILVYFDWICTVGLSLIRSPDVQKAKYGPAERALRTARMTGPTVLGHIPRVTTTELALIIAAGSLCAGLLGALTGLGGGIIVVPMLTLLFKVDLRYAIGASLVSVIGTSSGAAAAYVREGFTNVRVGILLELATTSGALVGAVVAGYVSTRGLRIMFWVLVVGAGRSSMASVGG